MQTPFADYSGALKWAEFRYIFSNVKANNMIFVSFNGVCVQFSFHIGWKRKSDVMLYNCSPFPM